MLKEGFFILFRLTSDGDGVVAAWMELVGEGDFV